MISRREVIKSLVISVGGSSLLSACGGRVSLGGIAPGAAPRFYTAREMALVSRVSDLMIPRTETPGALDEHVPELLDQLMTEWANAETKAAHREALAALETELGSRSGGDFLTSGDDVAQRALASVDAEAFAGRGLPGYRNLKGLITQMYFSTEGGALDEEGWVAAPGRWDPCVDL